MGADDPHSPETPTTPPPSRSRLTKGSNCTSLATLPITGGDDRYAGPLCKLIRAEVIVAMDNNAQVSTALR
jgi:hypothetical protein